MWVVKLGGSLACSNNLCHWLRSLVGLPVVLVPGGGPFADQVRNAQQRWKFADDAAHHMALLAMEQYGRMVCALQPGLEPASSPSEIQDILERGIVPVWMAADMALEESQLERSWDVTSDSLAAWLTGELSAEALLLIKSAAIEPAPACLDELTESGLVDKEFSRFARAAGKTIWIMSDRKFSAGRDSRALRDLIGRSKQPLHTALCVVHQ